MNEDQWYFAYGSNLSTNQKEARTGPVREKRRGRLEGYRLTFNKRGDDGTGKATIVEERNATVWGVVYRCGRATLLEMDKREGVDRGHYTRAHVCIQCDDGGELDAITYVGGPAFTKGYLAPSEKYLATILKGARENGLPDRYIDEIKMASLHPR